MKVEKEKLLTKIVQNSITEASDEEESFE